MSKSNRVCNVGLAYKGCQKTVECASLGIILQDLNNFTQHLHNVDNDAAFSLHAMKGVMGLAGMESMS